MANFCSSIVENETPHSFAAWVLRSVGSPELIVIVKSRCRKEARTSIATVKSPGLWRPYTIRLSISRAGLKLADW